MRITLTLVVSALLTSFGDPPPGDTTVPAPKFEPLPGKAIGVLVWDVGQMAAGVGRSGPAGAVGFVQGDASFRWVYLPASGDPDADDMTFTLAGDGKQQKLFPKVKLATQEMVKRLGLTGPFNLVEVEVNGGAGSAPEEAFAATALRRLDGTKDYPVNLADTIRDLQERTRKNAEDNKNSIAKAMEEARERVAKGRKPTGPEETAKHIAVTWLPDKNRLRIAVTWRVTNGFYVVGKGVEGPSNTTSRAGTQFGAAGGLRFEIDPSGRVASETPMPYRPFTREIPLPQGIDRH